MSTLQFAWVMYLLGAAGCSLVAWWIFGWAPRFVRYSAVATTLVLLLVPFSVDKEVVTLAPALFAVVFEGMAQGAAAMERPLKLLISVWVIVEIIIGAYVFLTRHRFSEKQQDENPANQLQVPFEKNSDSMNGGVTHENLENTDEDGNHPEVEDVLSSSDDHNADPFQDQKPRVRKKPSVDRASSKKPTSHGADTDSESSAQPHNQKSNSSKAVKTRVSKEEAIRAIRD